MGDPYAPFSIWFKYMKYTLLAALSSLLTGILYNIYSVVDVYMIKFPDFWIQYEANGACSKADWTEQYAPDEVVSVWGFSRMKLYVTMSTGLTATLLFMSAATRGKYRAERNLKDWPYLDVTDYVEKKKGEEGFRYKSYKWPYYVLMQAYEAYSDPKNNDIKSEMRTRDEFAKTFARSSMKA